MLLQLAVTAVLMQFGAASASDAAGHVVAVGGDRIATRLLGERGPVVAFVSGLGEPMAGWLPVAARLTPCARAFLYDRPGTGESGPSRVPAVLASAAADTLAGALAARGLPAPYVLVGHSLGGLYVQAFARSRPGETAAVLLVDAASPFEPPGVFVSSVPPPPGSAEAAEEAGVAASNAAILVGPPLPPVPLTVLAATHHGDTPEREALWQRVQAETAAETPSGRLVRVEGAGHFIHTERPDVVAGAILDLLDAAGADTAACRR